jgi:hypothetical protein
MRGTDTMEMYATELSLRGLAGATRSGAACGQLQRPRRALATSWQIVESTKDANPVFHTGHPAGRRWGFST